MTTLVDEISRVQIMLQDIDTSVSNLANIATSISEAAQKLARLNYFPQLTWVNAISGTSVYNMPATNVDIEHVLYNERVLRYITESSFDRKLSGWELLKGEPKYWTSDNLAKNTFRIIPAPTRTGSALPVIPPVPIIMPLTDNILVFATEDISTNLDAVVPMPTLLDYDDWLVYYS